jgi:hypothetical protein
MDQSEYEKNLKKVQYEHLDKINRINHPNWKPCLHDQCQSCHGTGLKLDGSFCLHGMTCSCPKCSITC